MHINTLAILDLLVVEYGRVFASSFLEVTIEIFRPFEVVLTIIVRGIYDILLAFNVVGTVKTRTAKAYNGDYD
jgi:hypothetical protein